MTTGILVVHTPAQAQRTSALCDALELALALPEGAIVCSSLPGYTLGNTTASVQEWNAAVAAAGAVVALVDDQALATPQFLFDLASAISHDKWVALLLEHAQQPEALPWQLGRASAFLCTERDAIAALIEDVAFQVDRAPRLGGEVQEAIDLLVLDGEAAATGDFAPRESGERRKKATLPGPMPEPIYASRVNGAEVLEDEFIALDDDELQELESNGLSCGLSLEAGRAISECSFHRESAGQLSVELDEPFGRFVNAVGGNWDELKRIKDVDVWLGATDNLLESLPPDARHVSDWFELGFQFSTLMSIAEQGLPPDPDQREQIEAIWAQSMDQFQRSAENAQLRHTDVHRVQALLESLILEEGRPDYSSIPRSLETLRNYAAMADG